MFLRIFMEQKNNLTNVYGLFFMANEAECKRVNDILAKTDASLFYIPRKFRMNIYFKNCIDASKVANYFNEKQNEQYYHIFLTSLESLERVKSLYEKRKKIRKHAPTMYHKLTGYKLYNTAEDYLEMLKENKKSKNQSSNEEINLSK